MKPYNPHYGNDLVRYIFSFCVNVTCSENIIFVFPPIHKDNIFHKVILELIVMLDLLKGS